MKAPTLGQGIAIDIQKLVETRLLIQANSGAGKSWAIRRLLEQTYGDCQHDRARRRGRVSLAAPEVRLRARRRRRRLPGRSQERALLARRLLELSVSAIVDIYELGTQRRLFVQRFLESLIEAPRDLWHPALIVVDEAHMFCPEAGKAESADAVKDLMTRGRKRGFGGVLATQRISKLHKDAAAEANNKLIGRSVQDIDMKRAAAELGFTSREDMLKLRRLQPGEFYAFGPAISARRRPFQGRRRRDDAPEGRAARRRADPAARADPEVLAQLADLPHEAEEEARTVDELRSRVRELERELRAARTTAPPPKLERVNVPVLEEKHVRILSKLFERFEARSTDLADMVKEVGDRMRESLATALAKAKPPPAPAPAPVARVARAAPRSRRGRWMPCPVRNGQRRRSSGYSTRSA
jgi:DNA helicase HerA-like ATPase